MSFLDKKNNKVLVTGATGFLGKHVVFFLEKEGYEVSTVSRNVKNNTTFVGDLTDRHFCFDITEGIDFIISCAAIKKNYLFHEKKAASILSENTLISINLLDASLKNNVKRFISPGSVVVYKRNDLGLYTEKSDLIEDNSVPHKEYAWSKRFNGLLCDYYKNQYNILTWAPRLDTIYGPYDNISMSGQLISKIIYSLVNQTDLLLDNKKSKRSYLFVEDAAKILVSSLRQNRLISPLNLTSCEQEDLTLGLVVDTISKELGVSSECIKYKDEIFNRVVRSIYPDVQGKTSFMDGIVSTISNYKK